MDEAKEKRKLVLDPSKFKIGSKGEVVVTDPEFSKMLQQAQQEGRAAEDAGQGIGIGIVVEF